MKKIKWPNLHNVAFALSFLAIVSPTFSWPHMAALLVLTALQAFYRFLAHQENQTESTRENRVTKLEQEIKQMNNQLNLRS